MNTPPYIPQAVALFKAWLNNFALLISTNPAAYGLSPAVGVEVLDASTNFDDAYVTAENPSTRNAGTITARNQRRLEAELLIRPIAMQIKANSLVTSQQLLDLGLTVNSTPPTPVPAPQTSPVLILSSAGINVHNLQYRDSEEPTRKAKPAGVKQCVIFRSIGLADAVDPDAAKYLGGFTKTPINIQTAPGDRGKIATYFARWETAAGPGGKAQVGPWGPPLPVVCL